MSKKIILFLSNLQYRKDKQGKAVGLLRTPREYTCPDGTTVLGTQTNDAPVRYLLRAHSDITEVICVTTKAAQAGVKRLEALLRRDGLAVKVTGVPYDENQNFAETAIPAIVNEHVREGDSIYLDTTGGFRNANMYLLLLSRVLTYQGISTAGAVYSNFQAKRVEDISHLIGMFDLVGGMQELSSMANVKSLSAYYQNTRDPKIKLLVDSMKDLTEAISICQTQGLDEKMKTFNEALNGVEDCSDPLMCVLIPTFREKFGHGMTTPVVIRWCVDNGMVQQALTLYYEQIPAYLLRERKDILEAKPQAFDGLDKKNYYESVEKACFEKHLLSMLHYDMPSAEALNHLEMEMIDKSESKLFKFKCSYAKMHDILADYLYIRSIRNMVNHANDSSMSSPKVLELEDYLAKFQNNGYKRLKDLSVRDIKMALLTVLDRISPAKGKEKRRG